MYVRLNKNDKRPLPTNKNTEKEVQVRAAAAAAETPSPRLYAEEQNEPFFFQFEENIFLELKK